MIITPSITSTRFEDVCTNGVGITTIVVTGGWYKSFCRNPSTSRSFMDCLLCVRLLRTIT